MGLGGAVETTMAAGIELLKQGLIGHDRLPLAELGIEGIVEYTDIVFAGSDLFCEHFAKAAEEHDVLTHKRSVAVDDALRAVRPPAAIPQFLNLIDCVARSPAALALSKTVE